MKSIATAKLTTMTFSFFFSSPSSNISAVINGLIGKKKKDNADDNSTIQILCVLRTL